MSKESVQHGKYTLPPIIMVQWKTHPKWKETFVLQIFHPFSFLNHDDFHWTMIIGGTVYPKTTPKSPRPQRFEDLFNDQQRFFQGSNSYPASSHQMVPKRAYAKTIDQQTNLGGGSTWLHQWRSLEIKPLPNQNDQKKLNLSKSCGFLSCLVVLKCGKIYLLFCWTSFMKILGCIKLRFYSDLWSSGHFRGLNTEICCSKFKHQSGKRASGVWRFNMCMGTNKWKIMTDALLFCFEVGYFHHNIPCLYPQQKKGLTTRLSVKTKSPPGVQTNKMFPPVTSTKRGHLHLQWLETKQFARRPLENKKNVENILNFKWHLNHGWSTYPHEK